jgi:hypothetical protein
MSSEEFCFSFKCHGSDATAGAMEMFARVAARSRRQNAGDNER